MGWSGYKKGAAISLSRPSTENVIVLVLVNVARNRPPCWFVQGWSRRRRNSTETSGSAPTCKVELWFSHTNVCWLSHFMLNAWWTCWKSPEEGPFQRVLWGRSDYGTCLVPLVFLLKKHHWQVDEYVVVISWCFHFDLGVHESVPWSSFKCTSENRSNSIEKTEARSATFITPVYGHSTESKTSHSQLLVFI